MYPTRQFHLSDLRNRQMGLFEVRTCLQHLTRLDTSSTFKANLIKPLGPSASAQKDIGYCLAKDL